jgi:hypothetical protein
MTKPIEDYPMTARGVGSADHFLAGFINEDDYARRRGVTVRTCQRDRQLRRSPPYVQLGRRILYRELAIRDWLVRRERFIEPPVSTVRRVRNSR